MDAARAARAKGAVQALTGCSSPPTSIVVVSPEQRTVWVVDDSPLDAERTRRALSEHYAIEVFREGAAVLERLAGGAPPDVLVLDWIMPGLSGLDVCRFIRSSSARFSRVSILMLTVHQRTEQVVEGLSAGANDYLSKPFAIEELRARVDALVRSMRLLERVESAEATVRDVLAGVPDALLVVDARGRITYANTEATRALHRPLESFLGTAIAEITPALSAELIASGAGKSAFPLPDITIDQEVFASTARVFPMDGGAVVLSLRNVTEQRRLEARRLDFYSIIAHDLRSPLSAILMRAELILRGKHGPIVPEISAELQRVQVLIRSLVSMINDFLDLASLEGTAYKLVKEELDIVAVAEAIIDDLRPLLHSGEIALEVRSEGRPTVLADRRRLAQVLANLLSNAIKFTPRGGVIAVRFIESSSYVETIVEDTGPGVAPEVFATLFQRYTTLRTAGAPGGTGLGLMIVREIVEAHGGTAGVESARGAGSKFWFRLPVGGWATAHQRAS
jgi:signal transduction histidine kinase